VCGSIRAQVKVIITELTYVEPHETAYLPFDFSLFTDELPPLRDPGKELLPSLKLCNPPHTLTPVHFTHVTYVEGVW
jgi:hypothetical protein